jgi:hypothetical protein
MESPLHHKQIESQLQGNTRVADLRRWMYLNNVTFVEVGRVCGITAIAAGMSLRGERMPVRHHKAITEAWPELPVELLPEPRDVPSGPKPKGLEFHHATA